MVPIYGVPISRSRTVQGVSAQPTQDLFRYRRAAFYSGSKIKVGLITAKTAALHGCLLASHVASRFPSLILQATPERETRII
jgi:hypothetical protein